MFFLTLKSNRNQNEGGMYDAEIRYGLSADSRDRMGTDSPLHCEGGVPEECDRLTEELKAAEKSKAGTQDSARAQTLLEQRIDTLRHEYIDTQSVMQQIRVYAEKEGANESREAAAGCQGKRVCAGF